MNKWVESCSCLFVNTPDVSHPITDASNLVFVLCLHEDVLYSCIFIIHVTHGVASVLLCWLFRQEPLIKLRESERHHCELWLEWASVSKHMLDLSSSSRSMACLDLTLTFGQPSGWYFPNEKWIIRHDLDDQRNVAYILFYDDLVGIIFPKAVGTRYLSHYPSLKVSYG